jgi:hypothetical protein
MLDTMASHGEVQCSPHQLKKGAPLLFPAEKAVIALFLKKMTPPKLFYPPLNASK